MADVHSAQVRSYNMSRIRSKNTTPEKIVRNFLYKNGFRGYRIHVKSLPGTPDIVFTKFKTIIDVRGCFWHGHTDCKWGDKVQSDSEIMKRVISAISRDKQNEEKWKQLGWTVIIIWDSCELESRKKSSLKRDQILQDLVKQLQQIRTDSSSSI
ncbi:MAG: DNA mismatch endonuclease Vsr, partial [Flavobacterium sp.]